jgi:DNA-binding transcriptional regulator YbjK
LLKIHIIPDLTLMLQVPMASMTFPTASADLLLEVPTTLVASIVSDPAARVVSNVEAAAANIQHLEEVLTASMALPMLIPTAAAT